MTVIQELLLEMERNVFLLEGLRKVPKDDSLPIHTGIFWPNGAFNWRSSA